ncbi:hypothetical protein GIB67_001287 [Kingdonia uniflora]|uniref:RST domain-containing protein n=1 Tax=Kingdonia uniflora TaxID=39325 RepID=A0A7J7LL65_9MAGN|nr:hypothetical protein GIB67_001287 [Kingdonia uniflora]
MLLPVITPHLDKGRAMQLNTIYNRLRKNEIGKDEFVRHMKNIVGDQMLRQAVSQIQMQLEQTKAQAAARNAPTGPHQFQKGQSVRMDPSQVSTSTIQVQTDSSQKLDNRSESQGMHVNQKPSSTMGLVSQERGVPSSSLGGPNKHQQHHTHLPQTSFPLYGSTASNYHSHPYSASSVTSGATSFKSQTQDSQLRQAPLHQAMASTQPGSAAQPMNMSAPMKYEVHNSTNDPRRLQGGSHPHITSHPTLQHNQVPWQSSMSKEQKSNGVSLMANVKHELVDQNREQQYKSQISASVGSSSFRVGQVDQGYTASSRTLNSETMDTQSTRIAMSACTAATHTIPALDPSTPVRTQVTSTSTLGAGINIKTTPKKPSIGQKKPLESLGTPTPPMASKKQRVSGSFQDQSIEQLNDVTAVSGVDLREEEEQLLSGPKVESRASEATRRAVQEEEEKLILQKIPLQKKLANILFSCGVKNISSDVERCLSLCVEERMRGILINLVRLSKQRVDIERPRHRTPITSDVGRQIFSMNQKVKEEWDKKQAEEAEKLRKINEAEGNTGADGDKEKDDGRLKSLKANKEEDDKMRTTAANVAARVAVGGDDALIRFQLMAEQGRQKREGGSDSATFTQLGIDAAGKSLAIGRTTRDNQDTEQRGPSTPLIALGAKKKLGKNPVVLQPKVVRTILVKDVIGLLERETQMSKSPLLYRLYERSHADAAAE